MCKTIAVLNQKGGVGKTTTTFNLGTNLAKEKCRVLLLDLDPQGSLSNYIGWQLDDSPKIEDLLGYIISCKSIDNALQNDNIADLSAIFKNSIRNNQDENIDYIPATKILFGLDDAITKSGFRGKERMLKLVINSLSATYDYILIDCPPTLGTQTINALTACDEILIPVQTEPLSLDGLAQIFETIGSVKALHNPNIKVNGILPTMANHTKTSKQVLEVLQEQFSDLLYKTTISRSATAPTSTVEQKSIKGKVGEQYHQLAEELIERAV